MMGVSNGWLLYLNGGLRAAIGLRQMLYVLPDEPATYTVPKSPAYATRVLDWQGHLVPLIDLHVYLYGGGQLGSGAANSQAMVGVVACAMGSESESCTAFGAFLMSRAPDRIQVSDSQACALPDELATWVAVAASCFRHPLLGPVPVLDLPAILAPVVTK
jgi:chemotaxis signal transduction protein